MARFKNETTDRLKVYNNPDSASPFCFLEPGQECELAEIDGSPITPRVLTVKPEPVRKPVTDEAVGDALLSTETGAP